MFVFIYSKSFLLSLLPIRRNLFKMYHLSIVFNQVYVSLILNTIMWNSGHVKGIDSRRDTDT